MSSGASGSSSGEEEDGQYEVECIYSAEAVPDKPEATKREGDESVYPGWSYLVKWAGYPDSENTWEHEDQFDEATQDLLERFWKAVGIEGDHANYAFGTQFDAPLAWIADEKKRFREAKEREEKQKKGKTKEVTKGRAQEKAAVSRQTKKSEVSSIASRKTVVASQPTIATRRPPPPKAGQPQLKTTGKSQSGRKAKAKSVDLQSDSDGPDEDLSSAPRKKGKKRTRGSAKTTVVVEADSEEFISSEEDGAATKPGLRKARVSKVAPTAETLEEDTAHNRRQALRDKLKEAALNQLKDKRNRRQNSIDHTTDDKTKLKSLSPVAEVLKEKKAFAQPARLWNAATSKPSQSGDGATDTAMQDAGADGLFSGGEDDEDMKDLFGDSPPPADAPAPNPATANTERAAAPRTAGPRSWKESRIKFYDPAAGKPAPKTLDPGNSPKPILAKQKILSRIMNAAAEGGPDQVIGEDTAEIVMEDATGARAEEDLPDYDEESNPVPSIPAPSSADDVAIPITRSPAGAHPSMSPLATGNQEHVRKTEPPAVDVVDLTKISSDQPETIDLMESDPEEGRADSDIVMLDSTEHSVIPASISASNSGVYFATIWTAGEAITNVKLMQVSALRKFAPKLTFLCREHRLDLVSYYSTATILPVLAQSKILQTGLLMFEPMGADRGTANASFRNLVHWLHDLSWVAGAYVEQPNERKKRLIILFHSTNVAVAQACQVPPWSSRDGILIAAVELPESANWSRNVMAVEDQQASKPPVVDPSFVQYTVEKLQFPRSTLINELSGKPYCVVPDQSAGDVFLMEDVRNLANTLDYFKAASRVLGEVIDQETIVFIHRRALRTLRDQMQEIIRLRKYPRVYFYCFGLGDPGQNDSFVEREPRLISPRGGILTFTPQALLEDPVGIVQLVNDLSKKQGWQCYIIPPVLAALQEFKDPQNEKQAWAIVTLMLASTKPEDRLILTESIDCVRERLRAKEQVAHVDEDQLHDKTAYMWTLGQFELLEADAGKLLDMCRVVATENSTTINKEDVVKKIFEDMLSMQRQPRLLESYRRFVVVTSSDREGKDDYLNQLDCSTASEFWENVRAEFAREQELAFVQTPPLGSMDVDSL
ncbi:hypothetical protein CALCODRAFT_501885 [Calocera cornea HHB12733]|uniref:Chromo domain-containing protein n=1 Tax=Calocera cornea HHB12733 TaxID=1353952 RepID=A0A165DGI9_9BASI|nr:hypothetical protein CALCODRAFT_501885 [Calocera cornea HHB12733]